MAERKRKKSDLEIFAGYERRQEKQIEHLEERIVNQFHIISEGLIDRIKLSAEGHSGILDRLTVMDNRLERLEKENERQHLETRGLVKLSFAFQV